MSIARTWCKTNQEKLVLHRQPYTHATFIQKSLLHVTIFKLDLEKLKFEIITSSHNFSQIKLMVVCKSVFGFNLKN